MESSDGEGEILPRVTDYHLIDHKNEPVSFSVLPLLWSNDDITVELQTQVHLCGMVDVGLQHICKEMTAWKYELSYVHPKIYVLSKDRRWIQLDSPKKLFYQTTRTTLVTVYSLHFAKKSPQASYVSMWSHLQNLKSFKVYVPIYTFEVKVVYLFFLFLSIPYHISGGMISNLFMKIYWITCP